MSFEQEAHDIVNDAVEQFDPSHVFGLFSGGHDSLCACHVASQHPRFSGCVHINTGIGVEETREFVRGTCRDYSWKLREYKPPVSYDKLVVEQGFPGPAHHWKMYHRLKERCLRQLLRETRDPNNRSRKVAFVSGVRKQESVRRMGNVVAPITTNLPNPSPRVVWVNPLINWSGSDKSTYISRYELPKNKVVELLCMSGECLCGAFAKPGELDEIRQFYPDAAAEIDRISALVKEAGQHCEWGTRPPGKHRFDPRQSMLCFSCEERFSKEEAQ